MKQATRSATATATAIEAATNKLYTYLKSEEVIKTEIYNYGKLAPGTGVITIYKHGSINAILADFDTHPAIPSVISNLHDSINAIREEIIKFCGNNTFPASECRKIKSACEILIGQLEQIKGIHPGGNKRKTLKGRRKQNKSRRNRKSRR